MRRRLTRWRQARRLAAAGVLCDACEDEPAVEITCVPRVPVSAAYGWRCLTAGAHPWRPLVVGTAYAGGLERSDDEWRSMVEVSCHHFGWSIEEFTTHVHAQIERLADDA